MGRKRSAFVPRAVLGASFGSVVPACVVLGLQACGTSAPQGVAAVAYCCFEASTPDANDASDAADAADATKDSTATDSATDADGSEQ
jgi:hypothetical protein